MQTILKKILANTMTSNNVPVLTYKIDYPSFTSTCSAEAAQNINRYYEDQARAEQSRFRTELYPEAVKQAEFAKENRYPFHPYEAISEFHVTCNSACVTSLYIDRYTYTGGAHGSTIRRSDTWNFRTGDRMTLSEFYPDNPSYQEAVLRGIDRQIEKQLKDGTNDYFDNYTELVRETFNPNSFYLTSEGITIYFQQYDIAPYSSGMPEFFFPFRTQ